VTTVDFLAEDAPGTLIGQVDSAFFEPDAPESGLCDAAFTPLVYVFEDGVVPNFTDEPVATTLVEQEDESMPWRYSIPLQAANYEAAFTCTGTDFIPVAGKPADILPAAETTVDFLADDAPAPE
jgi:hypothetical protein